MLLNKDIMSIKIDSITIPDIIINKMKDQLEKTRISGIEHGFNICRDNGNIIDKDECTGTYCQIKMKGECEGNIKKIGDYHTHPRGSNLMSINDLYVACLYDFKCIGSVRDNEIKCFVKKPISYPKNCLNEAKDIILERERLSKNKEHLIIQESILNRMKNRISEKEYSYSKERLDQKIKMHNTNVTKSIMTKDIVKEKYFKDLILS